VANPFFSLFPSWAFSPFLLFFRFGFRQNSRTIFLLIFEKVIIFSLLVFSFEKSEDEDEKENQRC